MRAYIDIAEVQRVSLALVFVDIRTAFAAVVRKLALLVDASDEVWKLRLRANGFSEGEISDIFVEVNAMQEWQEAGGVAHVLSLLADFHENTWISSEGLARVVRCSSGSLAGTPLADLVFVSAFRRVTRRLQMRMQEEGYDWWADADGAAA